MPPTAPRISAGDRDRRVALAAGDIGDTRWRIRLEPLVQLGDLREPLAAEQLLEHRTRELRLTFVEVGAVVRVRDAVAAPERVEHGVDRANARDDELPDRRDVVEARLVEQRLVVTGWKREVALVVDLEDPRRRPAARATRGRSARSGPAAPASSSEVEGPRSVAR
jgi:hypothetical protein